MRVKDLVRVFVKGGIISPGDFLKIINTARDLGTDFIHFGSRQDILFPVKEKKRELLDEIFKSIDTDYEIDEFNYQNIASSYVALDIMPSRNWLASHIYHYILDSFDYRPKFRVNVADPMQSLVPLFTGNINFIASSQENYWYLYLRFKEIGDAPWPFPILVYGYDLATVARHIEELEPLVNGLSYHDIYERVMTDLKINTQPLHEELIYSDTTFPYYEGLNREADGKYWLGLYWRNNKFRIDFLQALCKRCIDTKVGKISLTPWKSFVIKGIQEKNRTGWEKLMGKYGINLRHSALELNWHLPALDEEALELKSYLVRMLDKQDISTYGLTFTVKSSNDIVLFTSVVIEKNNNDDLKSPETYNVLYSKDFNPNLSEYYYYARNVVKDIIPSLLIELSHTYFEQLEEGTRVKNGSTKVESSLDKVLYQCSKCMTIYDQAYGDIAAGISPGVPFKLLGKDYNCPLCGAAKKEFVQIKA